MAGSGRTRNLSAFVRLVLASKVLVLLVIVVAYAYFPPEARYSDGNYVYPPGEVRDLASPFKTWDARHYLRLSETWYVPGNFSNAYYPLFPALIGLVNRLSGNPVISGLLVANVLSVAGFYVFYRYVEERHGPSMATRALAFLLAFPTAFYFSLIYSESVFFLLSVSFFLFLARGAYGRAWVFAFALPLTRPLGIAILVPFLMARMGAAWHGRLSPAAAATRGTHVPNVRWTVALAAAPLIGFMAYLTIMGLATGDPFEGFAAQQRSIGGWSLRNLLHPELFVRNFLLAPPHLRSYTSSIVDRAFFLCFLALCPLIYRVSGAPLLAYAIVLGSTPLLGSFMSYERYLLPIFPLYIALAHVTQSSRLASIWIPLLVLAGLQALLLALHTLNYWVA